MSESLIEVRSASLDDVIGIVYVQATTWLSDYVSPANGISEADIRSVDFQAKVRDWQHMIQSSSYQVLVAAKRGGEIIGVLTARRDNETQIIEQLYVLREYGQSGYERELLLPALLWLQQGDGPVKARVVSYYNRAIEELARLNFDLSVEGEVDFIHLPTAKNIPTIELIQAEPGANRQIEPKSTPLVKPRKQQLVSRATLARRANMRVSTIKYYSEIGLLPFEQYEQGLSRRYNLSLCLQRLREIKKYRSQGLSLTEIQQRLQ